MLVLSPVAESRPDESFAEAIRAELDSRHWSQGELATFVGRDASTVSLWVTGRQVPRLRQTDDATIQKLASFLHRKPADLKRWLKSGPRKAPAAARLHHRSRRLTTL